MDLGPSRLLGAPERKRGAILSDQRWTSYRKFLDDVAATGQILYAPQVRQEKKKVNRGQLQEAFCSARKQRRRAAAAENELSLPVHEYPNGYLCYQTRKAVQNEILAFRPVWVPCIFQSVQEMALCV